MKSFTNLSIIFLFKIFLIPSLLQYLRLFPRRSISHSLARCVRTLLSREIRINVGYQIPHYRYKTPSFLKKRVPMLLTISLHHEMSYHLESFQLHNIHYFSKESRHFSVLAVACGELSSSTIEIIKANILKFQFTKFMSLLHYFFWIFS